MAHALILSTGARNLGRRLRSLPSTCLSSQAFETKKITLRNCSCSFFFYPDGEKKCAREGLNTAAQISISRIKVGRSSLLRVSLEWSSSEQRLRINRQKGNIVVKKVLGSIAGEWEFERWCTQPFFFFPLAVRAAVPRTRRQCHLESCPKVTLFRKQNFPSETRHGFDANSATHCLSSSSPALRGLPCPKKKNSDWVLASA